ncbi:MAG: lactate utilization protein [Oscillospiraceae bacterium]|nr:lactate utilization protein [Oscillospiraceae bacterium]
MNQQVNKINLLKINRTGEALKQNNMEFHYAETCEDAVKIVEQLLTPGDTVAAGGSQTIKQCGVLELLKSDKYKYFDRDAVSIDELEKLYRASFSANAYISSTNAITENGELYNVDGNSNRIAAIAFGPQSVIILAGYNKIVKNIDEAVARVKSMSAPANAMRLNAATDCYETGECSAAECGMTDGCDSSDRICCNYLISAKQKHKNRIKVIIINEALGY